jgi:hypothetical protein
MDHAEADVIAFMAQLVGDAAQSLQVDGLIATTMGLLLIWQSHSETPI